MAINRFERIHPRPFDYLDQAIDQTYSCLHCLALILVELQDYPNDIKLKRKTLICSTVMYPTTVIFIFVHCNL